MIYTLGTEVTLSTAPARIPGPPAKNPKGSHDLYPRQRSSPKYINLGWDERDWTGLSWSGSRAAIPGPDRPGCAGTGLTRPDRTGSDETGPDRAEVGQTGLREARVLGHNKHPHPPVVGSN